jgi:lambda repressor-like predicted transcriptional regulator
VTALPFVMDRRDHPAAAGPTREQRNRLVSALYEDGMPVAEIAARAGVCIKTVRNVARRAGLPSRNPPQPERDAAILARYIAGDPVAAIAADHGVRPSRVRVVAERAGVPPRSGWQRRYPIREDAFDQPTATGWWLIGLLAADGSINAREHRVSLCQTLDDADVLYAFYDYVGCPDRPLTVLNLSKAARERQYKRRPAAEARVFSKRIVEALGRHGVVPRKSATLELSQEACWEPAVWLGLLDGDGSVASYRGGRDVRVRFSGTRRLMEQCETFWRQVLPYDSSRPAATPHRKGLWQFGLQGTKARKAAALLLAATSTSLVRKRALLTEIASWEPVEGLCPDHTRSIV